MQFKGVQLNNSLSDVVQNLAAFNHTCVLLTFQLADFVVTYYCVAYSKKDKYYYGCINICKILKIFYP